MDASLVGPSVERVAALPVQLEQPIVQGAVEVGAQAQVEHRRRDVDAPAARVVGDDAVGQVETVHRRRVVGPFRRRYEAVLQAHEHLPVNQGVAGENRVRSNPETTRWQTPIASGRPSKQLGQS